MAQPASDPIELTAEASLTGPQRAAILLMYLDRASARTLLQRLTLREVEEVGHAMADFDSVAPEVVEGVVREFIRELTRSTRVAKSGREFALDVLPDLVGGPRGEKVGGALRRTFSNEFREYCAEFPAPTVAALLGDEHPQTRAVALLLMGTETAARILELLPEEERIDLSLRMARVDGVPSEIADDIERAIREALDESRGDRWALQGVDETARVLGRMSKPSNEPVLGRIEETDPALSDTLKRRMVTFPDLASLDDRSVQALLKSVDRNTLLVALRGAGQNMRDLFLKNMSSRAAADTREEIDLMPPLPRARVNLAQEEVVQVAQRLAAEGTVRLYTGGDELV